MISEITETYRGELRFWRTLACKVPFGHIRELLSGQMIGACTATAFKKSKRCDSLGGVQAYVAAGYSLSILFLIAPNTKEVPRGELLDGFELLLGRTVHVGSNRYLWH